MEDKVKQFLASGKLEEYVLGILDPNDLEEVLRYIKKYPAVNEEYQVLQDQLETLSVQQSVQAPIGMKSKIMESLPDKKIAVKTSKIPWSSFLLALATLAIFVTLWAKKNSDDQLKSITAEYKILASECEERNKQFEKQSELMAFYNSPQTLRYDMEGNQLAPNFKAMVFVNEPIGKAMLKPANSLTLPSNKCLQLWGDLNGEMIPIAVLDNVSNEDYDLQINSDFTSLNVTIEEKTQDGKGQLHPDVSQLISSITI